MQTGRQAQCTKWAKRGKDYQLQKKSTTVWTQSTLGNVPAESNSILVMTDYD